MTGASIGVAFVAAVALGWWSAVAVACIALAIALMNRRRHVSNAAVAVSLVAIMGAWLHTPLPATSPPPWLDAADALRGRVVSVPAIGSQRQRFVVAVDAVRTSGAWRSATGRVCSSAPASPRLNLDDHIHLPGQPEAPADLAAGPRAFLRTERCVATVDAFGLTRLAEGADWRRPLVIARQSLDRALARAAPGDDGALLAGLLTGDDHPLSWERRQAFLLTGTSHVTAVSGSNIALILAVAATLGHGGRRRRLPWQIATLLGVWAYAALAGMEPPAARAALVATGAVFASRVGRRPDYITLILLAAALQLALVPADVWRLSFQLSLAASLALAALLPSLQPRGVIGWTSAALLATSVAQLATLPVALPAFGAVSVASIPANLLIAPMVDIAFPLAALTALAGLVSPDLAAALVLPARFCTAVIFQVVERLAQPNLELMLLPVPTRLTTTLVAIVAAVGVTLSSRDGQRWAARTFRAVRRGSRSQP